MYGTTATTFSTPKTYRCHIPCIFAPADVIPIHPPRTAHIPPTACWFTQAKTPTLKGNSQKLGWAKYKRLVPQVCEAASSNSKIQNVDLINTQGLPFSRKLGGFTIIKQCYPPQISFFSPLAQESMGNTGGLSGVFPNTQHG